jgi:hypothetical protein
MGESNGVCVQVVPRELLEALASKAPVDVATSPASADREPFTGGSHNGHSDYQHRLLVEKWLQDRGIAYRVKPQTDDKGRRLFVLAECPFDSSHGAPDSCIMQEVVSGKMSAQCFHDSCRGRGWQQFKQAIGKPGREHYDPPMTPKSKRKAAKSTNTPPVAPPPKGTALEEFNDPHLLAREYRATFQAPGNLETIYYHKQDSVVSGWSQVAEA